MMLQQLTSLPIEILELIIAHLPNCAIKALRLTSRLFHTIAQLRLSRIFLSAHELDIHVFRAVADHPVFYRNVVEIVWDDGILRLPVSHRQHAHDPSCSPCPQWFHDAYQENVDFHNSRYHDDELGHSGNVELMPPENCWAYYQSLFEKQEKVLATGADADAFVYGLQRFPALRTITVTPAAHGHLHHPLYYTPTIRAFPAGFNYPIPRGWPNMEDKLERGRHPPWFLSYHMWHGLLTVLRKLHENPHRITALILDAHNLTTGLHCSFFSRRPPKEYGDFSALLRQPGFRRLDLAMTMFRQTFPDNWCALRRLSNIKNTLAEIGPHLEHLSLSIDQHLVVDRNLSPNGPMTYRVSFLNSVFPNPAETWPHLQHFGLGGVFVAVCDLLALLRAMPPTLRSLDLGRLCFIKDDEHWRGLLVELRDSSEWLDRRAEDRVQVRINLPIYVNERLKRIISVEEEVNAFLYHGGDNPFQRDFPNRIRDGVGVIMDAFDPGSERPNVTGREPDLLR